MICLRTLLRIYEEKSNPKKLKYKKFFAAQSCPHDKNNLFLRHNSITRDWNLEKLVPLEASTKPHVHQKIEIF
jgi:hypothetical protein